MAANTGNKRIPVKWVRDRAKSAYDKKEECFICKASQDLELHHTHSITLLLNNWSVTKKYDISTDAGILEVRDEFIEEHYSQIYDDVFTLCNKHHMALHSVYGKAPSLTTAKRQVHWIEVQKAKFENGEIPTTVIDVVKRNTLSSFSAFY